jgi:hypothetical protein
MKTVFNQIRNLAINGIVRSQLYREYRVEMLNALAMSALRKTA